MNSRRGRGECGRTWVGREPVTKLRDSRTTKTVSFQSPKDLISQDDETLSHSFSAFSNCPTTVAPIVPASATTSAGHSTVVLVSLFLLIPNAAASRSFLRARWHSSMHLRTTREREVGLDVDAPQRAWTWIRPQVQDWKTAEGRGGRVRRKRGQNRLKRSET